MNCKPGDLAVVVGSLNKSSKSIGKIVRCIRFVPPGTIIEEISGITGSEAWETDVPVERYSKKTGQLLGVVCVATDRFLRPIRDNEGEDETLTLAGKPQEVKA